MVLRLTSGAFKNGERIPARYTCDGEDCSPPLAWSGTPAGTRSLVVLCNDPDAPAGTWHHWALFDIPAGLDRLEGGYCTQRHPTGMREAINDFKRAGYGGPCPPPAHGVHHYHFELLALRVDKLGLPARSTCAEVERAARLHMMAQADLTGLYSR